MNKVDPKLVLNCVEKKFKKIFIFHLRLIFPSFHPEFTVLEVNVYFKILERNEIHATLLCSSTECSPRMLEKSLRKLKNQQKSQ